ncbi:MAG: flagellar hook-basal body complex protein FliE [Bacteriovoracaceae bacterium]|nr:flagellar hook-basal body complex protein FliE [Bacteriovoracaceae bacterium]
MIKDAVSLANILKTGNTNEWVKSANIEGASVPRSSNLTLDNDKKTVSFSEMLVNSISEVNNLQQEANKAIEKLATGKSKNIHETMLSVEKADIAFRTMNQIRSKVIEAYKEVMRMQM